jgi:mono/diheme cytochrome c family protein
MKISDIKGALILTCLAICCTAVMAQQKYDAGKQAYEAYCASCHGKDATGNGQMAPHLRSKPTDLTLLKEQNKGVFPMQRLYSVIEGSNVPSHGTPEMPVWGREFRLQDAQNYLEARGRFDSEALVRARIMALLEYINRLQLP